MDARLHSWAATGDYTDDGAPFPDRESGHRSPSTTGGIPPLMALMVPAGIICGALLALACVGRLLVLPFTGRGRSR